jgi:hypothetical protein
MKKDKINHILGILITKEKYRFIQNGLLGEVVSDFFKEYENEYGEDKD